MIIVLVADIEANEEVGKSNYKVSFENKVNK